ncbi:MAG TPA: PspC domain-containing protein [Candidatus Nitrosocosmicus sp.]|nr:PspC domain-containing protein [Candidatus Nitrosocosmicus sp.]
MASLVRPKRGRMIGGVAIGLAQYFNISVPLVRIIWVILLLPGGLPGLIPYVLCWIIIPAEEEPYIIKEKSV